MLVLRPAAQRASYPSLSLSSAMYVYPPSLPQSIHPLPSLSQVAHMNKARIEHEDKHPRSKKGKESKRISTCLPLRSQTSISQLTPSLPSIAPRHVSPHRPFHLSNLTLHIL